MFGSFVAEDLSSPLMPRYFAQLSRTSPPPRRRSTAPSERRLGAAEPHEVDAREDILFNSYGTRIVDISTRVEFGLCYNAEPLYRSEDSGRCTPD